MSSHIILQDGRGWSAANWAFRAALTRITAELRKTEKGVELGNWLSEAQIELLVTYGLDIRELTQENQTAFCAAVRKAIKTCEQNGPKDWNDPEFFSNWLNYFKRLENMIEAIEHNEPPTKDLNDFSKVIERSSEKIRPGWA